MKKAGEIFEFEGVQLEVVEWGKKRCISCFFHNRACGDLPEELDCVSPSSSQDEFAHVQNILFVEVKKDETTTDNGNATNTDGDKPIEGEGS